MYTHLFFGGAPAARTFTCPSLFGRWLVLSVPSMTDKRSLRHRYSALDDTGRYCSRRLKPIEEGDYRQAGRVVVGVCQITQTSLPTVCYRLVRCCMKS